jgi:hypothetical protein
MATDHANPLKAATAAVLTRNDRYLHGLVEAQNVCPFAQTCRHQGKLWRAISWQAGGDGVDRLLALADRLEAVAQPVEVGLLLLPGLGGTSPKQLDELHRAFRDKYTARADGPSFYVVPFHPDYACNPQTAGSLVRYWRKSPDATLQFVHIETLEGLRRASPREELSRVALRMLAGGHTPEQVVETLQKQDARQGTSQRVADQNFERFEELGRSPFDTAIQAARALPMPATDASWSDWGWEKA